MKPLKHLLTLVLFVLLSTAFTACKSTSAVLPTPTTETNTDREEKTIIHKGELEVPADSTYKKLYLECVNGKVVIKKPSLKDTIKTPSGEKKQSALPKKKKGLQEPKATINDNVLEIDCYQDAQKLFYDWKETWIKEHKTTTIKIPYAVVTPLTWWQKTRLIAGSIFLGLIALVCVATGLRLLKVI